jgi:hypothetical protein
MRKRWERQKAEMAGWKKGIIHMSMREPAEMILVKA